MDTGSHLLFGVTLAGLATIDPTVAAHPETAHAVLAAALIGSHAPDFDSVMRLWGKPAYIRHHRGLTHSLPAPIGWALLIGLPVAALFGAWEYSASVVLWTFIAVCFHIVLDLFNAYGVQCLRPFSRKWWHLDVLCLFDPYLFGLHALAVMAWVSGIFPAVPLFTSVYALTVLYIGWRTAVSRLVTGKLRRAYSVSGAVTLVPSLLGDSWQFVVETSDTYVTGTIDRSGIKPKAEFPRKGPESLSQAAKATMATDGVRAFLYFADRIHVQVQERIGGYEVTWSDIRFWHDHKMPFRVDVTLDSDLNVLRHHIGWNKKTWEPPHV